MHNHVCVHRAGWACYSVWRLERGTSQWITSSVTLVSRGSSAGLGQGGLQPQAVTQTSLGGSNAQQAASQVLLQAGGGSNTAWISAVAHASCSCAQGSFTKPVAMHSVRRQLRHSKATGLDLLPRGVGAAASHDLGDNYLAKSWSLQSGCDCKCTAHRWNWL